MNTNQQSGFSAVELLVTLFVAAAFLATGFMLYTTIVRESGNTRQRSQASNIAYDYVRRYAAQVPATCSVSTPLNNTAVSTTNLENVRVTVRRTCPSTSATPGLSRVEATVQYGITTDRREVVHAIYAAQ